MKHVTYRVPDDFSERLKRYAAYREVSLNKAIDDALNEAILRVGLDSHRATPDQLGHHGPKARDRK
jgi:hypothetical protein